ncbi:MAG: hypothetical protein JWQ48_744 [Conexibacter sp.]|nr:hypothetical protein [Conexibacter sp.]
MTAAGDGGAAGESPVLTFATPAELAAWIASQPPGGPGAWLRFAKRGARLRTITYAEALDVALCHGWIDGQVRRLDDEAYLQRFTPRRARSRWSERNVGYAERLIAEGAMQPNGLAEVERAKADGRWEAAYAGPRTIEVPDDLRQALDANPPAAACFATLDSHNRYAVLYRVGDARRPQTRARRIARFVAMLAAGEKLHP